MVGRGITVAALSVATACSFGSVTTKRAADRMGLAGPIVAQESNIKTPALRSKVKVRMRLIPTDDDTDVDRDLDRLQARIDRLWIRVENVETALLRNIESTPDREITSG